MRDEELVQRANQRFYEAHESRDLSAMGDLWLNSPEVVCIHPGWPILRGWEAVMDSWARIFSGPGRNQFILTNQAIQVVGDSAWVTLEENLVDRGATHAIAATNVFARSADGTWQLVVHHGSPVLAALGDTE